MQMVAEHGRALLGNAQEQRGWRIARALRERTARGGWLQPHETQQRLDRPRLQLVGLVTVPEVLKEIRDRQARQMLASLPVELTTREPSSEALTAIKSFAKLTGDLPALSVVDLRVLALAWMLEKEAKGGIDHLRTEPAPVGQTLPRYPRSRQAQARDEQPKPAVQDPAGASSLSLIHI